MGALVFLPEENPEIGAAGQHDWTGMVGNSYEGARESVEENVLMPLQHPDTYSEVMKGTRGLLSGTGASEKENPLISGHPKAVLFDGPPGCGKTSTARIISQQARMPLVYVPLDSIMSKWYGESEKQLTKIFEGAKKLQPQTPGSEGGRALIFIDEIDAVGVNRDAEGGVFEASRRVLTVLLNQVDGFKVNNETTLIAATNRTTDLDSALRSRFDTTIHFPLPDGPTRSSIFGHYARHLSSGSLKSLAEAPGSSGLSGRDIKGICRATERSWAADIVRKRAAKGSLPDKAAYLKQLKQRAQALQ